MEEFPLAKFAVFGHPVAHSKSPWIHQQFAQQFALQLEYQALELPLEGFAQAALQCFTQHDFLGANVTVPFKEQAFALCQQLTPEAQAAGAVNTLVRQPEGLLGHNTDGLGLVADLEHNCGLVLAGKRILLLGAGGAVRGVIGPLLAAGAQLVLSNRTLAKAEQLAQQMSAFAPQAGSIQALPLEALGSGYDYIINGTSASLSGQAMALDPLAWQGVQASYDMMYGPGLTAFNQQAQAAGVAQQFDGLGMLVEQAALAFACWWQRQPQTQQVLQQLRQQLG